MDSEKKKSGLLKAAVIIGVLFVLLFYMMNYKAVSSFFTWLNEIFMPVFVGIIIAYLLNPIMIFYEKRVLVWKKDTKAKVSLCRALSLVLTFLSGVAIIALILLLIIPQLVNSIRFFVDNFDSYLQNSITYVNNILSNILNNGISKEYISVRDIQSYLGNFNSYDGNFLQSLIQRISSIWGTISQVGTNVIMTGYSFIRNGIIGLFIAFYILASKELRIAQFKKIRTALLSDKINLFIDEVIFVANKSFGGFIKGKIIDSLIIGVLSFILFQVFRVSEFNIMLAAIIGITNVVPVFGPVFGAIPAGFIVLVTNPSKLLIYIILVILIQQLDGNIIGPAILGNSTQISTLAVVVAIVVMGEMFGVFGMIIGVPLTATVVTIVKRHINKRLIKNKKSTAVEDYFIKKIAVAAESADNKTKNTLFYKLKNRSRKSGNKPSSKSNNNGNSDVTNMGSDTSKEENTSSNTENKEQ